MTGLEIGLLITSILLFIAFLSVLGDNWGLRACNDTLLKRLSDREDENTKQKFELAKHNDKGLLRHETTKIF